MKFLIVLGLFPLISASPYNSWARNQYFQRPNQYNNQGSGLDLVTLLNAFAQNLRARQSMNQGYDVFPNQRPNVYSNQGPTLYNNQATNFNSQDLVTMLKDLAQDPRARQIIDRVFNKDAVCLTNIEEAIQAVEEGSNLMAAAEGDLDTLTSSVESLKRLTDEVEVVREVASIFRVLDSLIKKFEPTNPNICSASSDSTAAYLNSLAVMMNEFSKDFNLDPQTRGTFAESASVLAATNGFLRNLKSQAKEFQSFCYSDKESSTNNIRVLGRIISSLADLAATLGNLEAAEEIRKGNEITEKIVVSVIFIRF